LDWSPVESFGIPEIRTSYNQILFILFINVN